MTGDLSLFLQAGPIVKTDKCCIVYAVIMMGTLLFKIHRVQRLIVERGGLWNSPPAAETFPSFPPPTFHSITYIGTACYYHRYISHPF